MKGEYAWRYNVMALGFMILGFLIIARLISIQFSEEGSELVVRGKNHVLRGHLYYPARGQIYDRWGNLLAGNKQVYEVGIDLYQVKNPETIAFAMSRIMSNHPGIDEVAYYNSIFTFASQKVSEAAVTYLSVANNVTQEELDQLKDWAIRYAKTEVSKNSKVAAPSLSGLIYRPRPMRTYPEGDLASSVLGFVDFQGQGLFGIEEQYNDFLVGQPQMIYIPIDPYRAPELPDIQGGGDLVLTLDRQIQSKVEEILDNALEMNGSRSGTIVVMNPQNGEIIAMASTPHIDLNKFYEYDEVIKGEVPYNSAVSQIYEPGSVFKVLTMAAALDAGAVTPDTTFLDTGVIEIGGAYIYNWNYGAWGEQDMVGCLQHSLNVCLTWIAQQLGTTKFYQYMQGFNLGHTTGIDIANEASGILRLPGSGNWYEADLGTNSFGQGISVTPVQMLMAVSALANDGGMVMPHLMRSMVTEGRQYTTLHSIVGTPIRAETAQTINEMLAISLEKEASNALVEGYRIAGKTGTAQVATPTGYSASLTNASFVGWGPIDDPQFMVYVWFEHPRSSPWGSEVASPVFSEVFREIVMLAGIPPDNIRHQLRGQ
jgi:cell division protein FtsI/penicillin-binding protein 2